MPAGSSSSKRKTGNLDQYKIIETSTSGPSPTNILFPSYLSWFTKSLESNGSQSSTLDGDTTMSASKKATNGKQHSKPAMACLNQQSCSLGWPTRRQHSKRWWTTTWRKKSTKATRLLRSNGLKRRLVQYVVFGKNKLKCWLLERLTEWFHLERFQEMRGTQLNSERKFTGRWKGNQVKLKAWLLARSATYILMESPRLY